MIYSLIISKKNTLSIKYDFEVKATRIKINMIQFIFNIVYV